MANISRTIDVIFNGKDSITPATRKISRGLHALEAGVDKTIEKADALADAFKKVTVAGTALGATLIGLALNEYKKYQDAWTDLVKVTEDGEAGLTGVSDEIRRVSRQYGEDITAITKSVFEFKRSGLEVSEALLATENAIKLVIAGNADMAESTQFLKQILAGFKLDADETTHIVDVLNIISDKYNTTVTELGIALSRISPSAEKMNISLEKTAALVTPIIEVFGSGEEASTAYRRGMLRLINESPAVIKALSDLGVAQREGPNKTLREGNDILNDYVQALQNKTKSEQLSYLTILFGERQASKLAESIGQLAKVQEIELLAANVKTQYTTDQVTIKLETLDRAVKKLVTSVRTLGKDLGVQLEDGAVGAINGITTLIRSIGDAAEDGLFSEVFNQFNALGKQLGDYFTDIAAALPRALAVIDYSGIRRAVSDLIGAMNASLEGLDLRKPEDLAKAIQFLIDTGESAIDTARGMLITYDKIKDVIIESIRAYNSLTSSQKSLTGEALATSDIMERMGKITGLFITQLGSAPDILGDVIRFLGSFGTTVTTNFRLFGLQVQRLMADALLSITTLVNNATGKSIGFINRSYEALKDENLNLQKEVETLSTKQEQSNASWVKNLNELTAKLDRAQKSMKLFGESLDNVPESVEVGVVVRTDLTDVDKEIDRIRDEITKKKAEELTIIKDQVADVQTEIGVLGDEYLSKFERDNIDIARLADARAEYVKSASKVEIEPTEDDKFKAAQQKLLKEIDTNASIMEARLKSVSDIAESNSATISSSFESVSDSISSSGDTLTELYNTLASGKLGMATFAVQRSIREEEERRQEAFELQKQLTTAQIDLIKQRASAMSSGDPLITVSGDGLQPHLEAFMWEILSAIQVRVNETYGNFLLGIGAS
jgi:TP901 family phage tail tape measure protein